MREFGELSGNLIIILFWLEAFRFVLKFTFKNYGKWIKEHTSFHPLLLKVMNLNKKIHPLTGYGIVILIGVHAYIQTNGFAYFSNTAKLGIIAALFMVTEVFIGFAGTYLLKKPRPKAWIWFHRLVPVAVLVAYLIHTN